MSEAYHQSRLTKDPRRDVLWRALWRHYFSRRVPFDSCVLDLGCGYGEFINNAKVRRRIAVDTWSDMPLHVAPGIETHLASIDDIDWIDDDSVDLALASNIFEHVTRDQLSRCLDSLKSKMTSRGVLTIIQPNFRYAYREYFDDFTHISIYSHVSLSDFLVAKGWEIVEARPRFLPLSLKGGLPVWSPLIAAYLASPLKPLGKQMLITARPCGKG